MKKHIQKFLWWLMLPSRTSYLEGVLAAERASRDGSLFEMLRYSHVDVAYGYGTPFDTGVNDYVALLSSYRGCVIREVPTNPCSEVGGCHETN